MSRLANRARQITAITRRRVYEAFELSQVPSDIWKNYEQRLLEMEKDKDRRRKRTRRLLAALVLLLLVFLPPAQAPGSVPGIMHPMGSRRMNRYPPRSLTTRSGIRVKNRCTSPLLPAREGFRRHTVLIAPASSGIAELDGCTGDEAFGQVAVMEQGHGAFIRIASGCKGRHCDPAI